uniref:ZZ-type domain-containing protein n=1 Tax=Lepeophtheirus salmonis TaxID=72036 RepID=A0A0K2SVM3_LEPSM
MAISKGPEGRVTITSFAMQPPSQVLNPWDDAKIKSRLKECDSILFAAYRTSTKLLLVQEALKLNLVKLNIVTHVLGHHGLGPSENDSLLSWNEVLGILRDVYSAGSKIRNYYSPSLNIEAYSQAARNILREIYRGDNSLSVNSLKIFLVLLSQGVLREKFVYLFRQFAHRNSDHCLTKQDLKNFLHSIIKFPEYFKESCSFGAEGVEAAVRSCFSLTNRTGERDVINEEIYLKWQLMEPQLLVWLPTFYRQTSAQGIRHGMRCSNCRTQDIIGMRYQCLRCLNYDTCQHCFFYGHVSRGHKVHHPMQEYCYRSTRRDETMAFIKKLGNNFRKRNSRDIRGRYLPASSQTINNFHSRDVHDGSYGFHSVISERRDISPMDNNNDRHKRYLLSKQKHNEVKSIIMSLEEHNEKRLVMSDHQSEMLVIISVREQLNKLKNVMETLFNEDELIPNSSEPNPVPCGNIRVDEPHSLVVGSTPLASYPCRKNHLKSDNKLSEIDLSPIVKQDRVSTLSRQKSSPYKDKIFTSIVNIEPPFRNSEIQSSVSCQDISSLLSRGTFEDDFNNISNRENCELKKGREDEVLSEEEIQSLMGRLENVFKSLEHPSPQPLDVNPKFRSKNLVRLEVNQLVTEISDQMNSFSRTPIE